MFVDWEKDFVNADDPVPVQLADAGTFTERAGALGIGDRDLVVTYDDYYGIFAGRVAWAFRCFGADARVLDGGFATWKDEQRPLFLGAEGLANTGHIPGSRCLPYQELVDGATGLWAAPAAVARLARDAGIDLDRPPQELIATCGSGVSATVALLSLERIGVHCRGVYDGSFNEWAADPARPVAYGSAQ